MIFDSSMADNNVAHTTEGRKRKQVHSYNGTRSPSLKGFNKDQWDVGRANSPKRISEKRKKERNATK